MGQSIPTNEYFQNNEIQQPCLQKNREGKLCSQKTQAFSRNGDFLEVGDEAEQFVHKPKITKSLKTISRLNQLQETLRKKEEKYMAFQKNTNKPDPEEEGQQIKEVEMKKVRVKWNEFIKIKRKRFTDDYVMLREIGKGTFGFVYKVILKNSNIYRAAKKIEKKNLGQQQHEHLLNQMGIMMSLDHPNIVKLYQVYEQPNFYFMVMELCEGGELFERIIKYKVSEEEIVLIIRQITSAVFYMHSKGVIHRDLKPENMLFDKNTKRLKIIDFGISTKLNRGQYLTERVGTPYYIAPQVLARKYNEKADMWCVGVTLFMMIVGSPPFKGKTSQEVIDKILHEEPTYDMEKWKKYSSNCLNFTKALLVKEQRSRLSSKKAFSHLWFDQYPLKTVISLQEKERIIEKIKNFHFRNKLEAVVQTFIISQLMHSLDKQQLFECFKEIDKNKNGIIQLDEFRYFMNKYSSSKMSDTELKKIVDYIDISCSGKISYTQFLVATIDFSKKVTREHYQLAFQYFDIDGSGSITFKEISQFLDEQNYAVIEKMFLEVDENADGYISKEEFVSLLMRK